MKKPTRKQFYIVRTENAGVFYGTIESRNDKLRTVRMRARRVWYWSGAFTLSTLATLGTSEPDKCKWPDWAIHELYQVIEILPTSKEADKSFDRIKVYGT